MKKVDGAWFEKLMQAKVWHDPYTLADRKLRWRGEVYLTYPTTTTLYDMEDSYIRVWAETEELAWEQLALELEEWRDSLRKEWKVGRNKQLAPTMHI